MKYMLVFLFLLPIAAKTQPYVLLDRQFKMPVELKYELESNKIAPFYFPVHQQDLDAMIEAVDYYIKYLDGKQNPLVNDELKLGHTRMVVKNKTEVNARGFSIHFTTRAKENGFSLELVHKNDTKRRGLQKMKAFLYYLRNNRFLVKEQETAHQQSN